MEDESAILQIIEEAQAENKMLRILVKDLFVELRLNGIENKVLIERSQKVIENID